MPEFDPVIIGALLIATGLAIMLLTLLILRALLQKQPGPATPIPHDLPLLPISQHEDSLLVIQPGGRALFINQRLRDWFGIPEGEHLNLEQLARRAHPRETFLSLCASEGKGRFSLQGLLMEGTSYSLPYEGQRVIVLTLRRPQLTALPAGEQQTTGQGLDILSEMSQAMTASLDLETTLRAILENVERLIPSDISEITLWDSSRQRLIPYRFVGASGTDRRLEKAYEVYTPPEGYSGRLVTRLTPMLIDDVDNQQDHRPAIDLQRYPIKSFLGIPLLVGGDPIGTLELASLRPKAFGPNELELLRLLSGQAAVAVHNALVYEDSQRRVAELAGLANLAQAVGSLRDPRDLFGHLVKSIDPLLDVEILGLIIYDEARRVLAGQTPFIGIPETIIELYRTTIEPDSPGEALFLSQEMLVTADAPNDPRLKDLGLDHVTQASGILNTALVPLTTGGRSLGYLQAGNKRDRTPLNDDDLRILAIIAGQAAPIIENAALIHDSRRRTRQAEAMRRIASLTGSSATMDEILKFSLQELARLLQADAAAIFLLAPGRGELRLHKSSAFSIPAEAQGRIDRIPVDDPQFHQTVTGSCQPFLSDDVHTDGRILPLYRPLLETLGNYHAVIDVPLDVREQGLGEIILASEQPHFFNPNDAQLAVTAARQIADALERSSLYTQTDETMRRRVDQLSSVGRISRELNTTFELQNLLVIVHKEALHITGADCGTLLLLESGSNTAEPKVIASLGDKPPAVLSPAEKLVYETREPILVEDFAASADSPPHPEVRSALIIPIAYQQDVLGIMHLHGLDQTRFDNAALEIAQILAVEAAIAFGNAHLFQENSRRNELLEGQVRSLSRLLETAPALSPGASLETVLESIAEGIQDATPYERALIGVYAPESKTLRHVCGAGYPPDTLAGFKAARPTWSGLARQFLPEYRLHDAYFIPARHVETPAQAGSHLPMLREPWHEGDLLLLPLLDEAGSPLGMIRVENPRDGLRPDMASVETVEIFAHQATLVIQRHLQSDDLKGRVAHLEQEIERSQAARRTAQQQLPILLHKDLEQTLSLHQLSQRARRMRASLDIAEIVNHQTNRTTVLKAIGQEMVTRMNFDVALVAEDSPGGPRLLHSLGEISSESNPEALIGQRNPLRQSFRTGKPILVADLEQDPDWQHAPLLSSLNARGFVCLPIAENGRIEASVLAISRRPLSAFHDEDARSFSLLASQVAITLQNLSLLTETRRRLREVDLLLEFSRQLGSLDPTDILRTLVDSSLRVIPHAHAGMVAIWEADKARLIPRAAAGYTDNQRILEIAYQAGEALPGEVFTAGQPRCIEEVDFARDYKLSPDYLLRYREATGGRIPVSSLLVPLQTGEIKLGVLALDNFNTPANFSAEDQALVTSLAQQSALALENARLFQASSQRAAQLQALTEVAGTITSSLQPDELIASLLDRLVSVLPFETGTLWILEGDQLTVRAAKGFDEIEQRIGLAVAVEDSRLLSEMIASGQPINVPNTHDDPRFPGLVEHPHLSWLGVPLLSKGEVAGVIALEKAESGFYSAEHVQAATTFAGQAAVALENARLFAESQRRAIELDQRSQRLDLLNRISTTLSESLDSDEILRFTVEKLREALGAAAVSAVVFDAEMTPWLQVETPSMRATGRQVLPVVELFDRLRQTLGVFNTPDVRAESELGGLADLLDRPDTRSLLALPLATGSDLHAVILVQSGRAERFPSGEVELARTISNQAAVALQNARLFDETRRLTEELERRVAERTEQLGREHRRTQTLLNIITELSASLDMDIILNRTLALINEIAGAEQSTILLTRQEDESLYYRASLGYTTPPQEGGQPSELRVTEGLAGWVITHQESVLVPDLQEDSRWVQKGELLPEHRSCIAVPLVVGEEALGTLMLFHREVDRFSSDQLDLIQATAKQIAVAINNAQLFRLIADQSERLGAMLRSQQIETSRSRAILESVADGVLVTDANGLISLFNHAGEEILNLERDRVLEKSLDAFIGLFGGAAGEWIRTIWMWSENPSTYQMGEIYSEQIGLEDGRVVAVNLAPVILRDEFLGTVSIFRDITHQVEVDRLKSEFVATVSHELRTPMTSIKGYVDVMLMGAAGELTPQQTHYMQVVKNNTERLNVLVNDLLDISRIEARKVTLAMQPIDLREIAERVVADTLRRSRSENKPMVIELHPAPKLPRVIGDPERIRQILFNLVDNAYNYTPRNGRVTIDVHTSRGEVQVDVRDNGIGIPDSEQARVFERFYRGEDPLVLATAGTGLGLSIVQHLIEMHRGRIWVQSSGVPGEGSTFSFTLPIYSAETQPSPSGIQVN